jgi:LacI family transcriptional regulator
VTKVATIGDVATRAGVARGTVSNYFNHPDKLAESTRERIRSAVEALSFVRNSQARVLASGRSATIGLLVTDLGNSFFVDIARGAEDGANQAGYSVLLANSDNAAAREDLYLQLFDEQRFAGVLLAPFESSTDALTRLRNRGHRVVLINVHGDGQQACSVAVDNEYGGYIAARHLIEQGRTRIACLAGPDRLEPLLERRLGVEKAIAEAGVGVSLEEIHVPAVNTPQGRVVGRELAARPPHERPDAIVAASDLLARGVVQELFPSVDVPREIAIIGYDNNSAARESRVPISTVAQPGHELGSTAAGLLVEELQNPTGHQHRSLRLRPQLLIRASSSSA